MEKTKIIIADDHALLSDGLVKLLASEPGYEVLTTVTNGRDLLRVLNSHQPDLVLLDIVMPLMNGFDTLIRIKERRPRLKVVLISMNHDQQVRTFVQTHPVDGFIIKEVTAPLFKDALRRILAGEKVVIYPPAAAAPDDADRSVLTRTETEVVKLIAAGLSTKAIAHARELSPNTVEVHRKNIYRKLGVKNMAEVTAYAAKMGWL